jgi:hypothetical protein
MILHFIYSHIWFILFFSEINKSHQTCYLEKIFTQETYFFIFQCYQPDVLNPLLPYVDGSYPSTFDVLELSPNLYTNISSNDLCQFTNIHTLDLSFNQLTTIAGVFKAISCFNQIQNITASYNQITTPLLGKLSISFN